MTDTSISTFRLVAELAVGISRRLQTTLEPDMDAEGFFFHGFQNPFDEACYVLWELDVARAAPVSGGASILWAEDQDASAAAFCFFSAEETRARITSRASIQQTLVDRVLAAFLGVSCDYGPAESLLSVSREPFRPQAEYDREINALATSGYVERLGKLVRWTEKIAPAMRTQHFWDASAALPTPRVIRLSTDAQRRVSSLLKQEQRLAAIKVICFDTGATISEAVRHIEEIERFGPKGDPTS